MTHRYDAKFSVRIAVMLVLRIKQQIKTVEGFVNWDKSLNHLVHALQHNRKVQLKMIIFI